VHADEERARQIVLNLVQNAIRFTETGAIRVSSRVDCGFVRIHVADTGRGIAADKLEAIFEPFVQVSPDAGAVRSKGLGLGLAISRDLARRMGGDILVTSTLGIGSVFELSLPRSDSRPTGRPVYDESAEAQLHTPPTSAFAAGRS